MVESSDSVSVERMLLARLETLDELLSTLAGVLDVRDVFARVSSIAGKVIPHDMISLPLLTEDKNSVVIYAIAGSTIQFPETVPLPEHHRPLVTSSWDYLIYPDIQADQLERASPPGLAGASRVVSDMEPATTDPRTMERTTIEQALQAARFNKVKAARQLGLSRKQLYARLRQHGLE